MENRFYNMYNYSYNNRFNKIKCSWWNNISEIIQDNQWNTVLNTRANNTEIVQWDGFFLLG